MTRACNQSLLLQQSRYDQPAERYPVPTLHLDE